MIKKFGKGSRNARVIQEHMREIAALKSPQDRIQKVFEQILVQTANDARELWIDMAANRFATMADEYISSIGPVVLTGSGETLSAKIQWRENSWLASALEDGTPKFDMKPKLLGGKDKRAIRMTFATSRTNAEKTGTRFIGRALSLRKMKTADARAIVNRISRGYGGKNPILSGFRTTEKKGRNRGRNLQHQSPFGARTTKNADQTAQTFRTVTKDSGGWIHPGFKKAGLSRVVQERAQRLLKENLKTTLEVLREQIETEGKIKFTMNVGRAIAQARRAGARGGQSRVKVSP